ncbi:Piso0_001791 [Millerozyma farinosa CBS 7064]|uniref:Piso0_001791 protein n=1 Tax=Pichia sorbitophila (strain ATCC MYA-4447 / BCRC 22081 / CBS 7064 / NBRC 10061 / NRRL Y-12695) TaxID=559304 RepID=G8YP39_PICSO|nr:Piso0_001791 [Millerozyma farinosa CBS 7064]
MAKYLRKIATAGRSHSQKRPATVPHVVIGACSTKVSDRSYAPVEIRVFAFRRIAAEGVITPAARLVYTSTAGQFLMLEHSSFRVPATLKCNFPMKHAAFVCHFWRKQGFNFPSMSKSMSRYELLYGQLTGF